MSNPRLVICSLHVHACAKSLSLCAGVVLQRLEMTRAEGRHLTLSWPEAVFTLRARVRPPFCTCKLTPGGTSNYSAIVRASNIYTCRDWLCDAVYIVCQWGTFWLMTHESYAIEGYYADAVFAIATFFAGESSRDHRTRAARSWQPKKRVASWSWGAPRRTTTPSRTAICRIPLREYT